MYVNLPPQVEKLNWNPPAVYRISGRSKGHRFEVVFRQGNFKPRGRRISWLREETLYYPAYGRGTGRRFYGYDGFGVLEIRQIPNLGTYLSHRNTELVSLTVTVDGKRWPIPKSTFEGFLDPDLGKDYETASVSGDGQIIHVTMEGSDGAGGYKAIWVLRRNGKHRRRVELGD